VFVVTPKSYDPSSGSANNRTSSRITKNTSLDCDHDWIDLDNPGPAHEPNVRRSVRGLQPTQAPYYPRAEEIKPAASPPPSTSSASSAPRFSRSGKH
jgi:hypothetical protein